MSSCDQVLGYITQLLTMNIDDGSSLEHELPDERIRSSIIEISYVARRILIAICRICVEVQSAAVEQYVYERVCSLADTHLGRAAVTSELALLSDGVWVGRSQNLGVDSRGFSCRVRARILTVDTIPPPPPEDTLERI